MDSRNKIFGEEVKAEKETVFELILKFNKFNLFKKLNFYSKITIYKIILNYSWAFEG